jgi:ribosomal protein S18 acetylase RimI-like enzyme
MSDVNISLVAPSDSEYIILHNIWRSTIVENEPAYSLPFDHFKDLLAAPRTTIHVARAEPATSEDAKRSSSSDDNQTGMLGQRGQSQIVGFSVTYRIRSNSQWNPAGQHYKGFFALLAVDPAYQKQGFGSALHDRTLQHLSDQLRASFSASKPVAEKSVIQLGTIFPRIFPGVPAGESSDYTKRWFEKRGWKFEDGEFSDLYQDFGKVDRQALEAMVDKRRRDGFSFGQLKEGYAEELCTFERENFDESTVSSQI